MLTLMASAWLILLDDEPGTSDDPRVVVPLILILFAILGFFIWLTVRHESKKRAELAAYLGGLGFKDTGNHLPELLRPPVSIYAPTPTVSHCWTGELNGLEVVLFETAISQGEGTLTRTIIAVRRPRIVPAPVPSPGSQSFQYDEESRPNWITLTIDKAQRRKYVQPLLEIATRQ